MSLLCLLRHISPLLAKRWQDGVGHQHVDMFTYDIANLRKEQTLGSNCAREGMAFPIFHDCPNVNSERDLHILSDQST
ncbi:hypothetical protein K439DRAFT_939147 [Ramaria rubella]|nr:hypothetical protein K439DRAFT_939147 [Ramaria rubella]